MIKKIIQSLSAEKVVKYRYAFLFFFGISSLIFLRLFLSPGSLVGSDWGFPDNTAQLGLYLNSLTHTWTRIGNFFGTRQLSSVSILIIAPLYLLAKIGIPITLGLKVFLVTVFALAGSNLNLLLGYLGIKRTPALIGGLVFILSPLFFDYTLIGWIYVLLSLALLPLFVYLLLLSLDRRDIRHIILAAIVFSLAAIQSQTLLWYPIVAILLFLVYGLVRKQIGIAIKYFVYLMLGFLLLNFYWLPALLLFPDQGAISGDLVKSSISVGTSFRLSSFNLLRLWGSLFNYQFETSYPANLYFVSVVTPLLATSSIFFYKKYKETVAFLLLVFLVPVAFYFVDRHFLASLPFANLIRDIARFSVLSTFAFASLTAISINELFGKRSIKWLLLFVLVLLAVNSYPFLSGQLFVYPKSTFDNRLRTKVWPNEYEELNDRLAKEKVSGRALFLPLGGLVSLSNDQRYNGAYQEIPDVYAGYSPVAAAVSFSDRSQGPSSEFVELLNQSVKDQNIDRLYDLARQAKIQFIVVRRDIDFYDWDATKKEELVNKLGVLVQNNQAQVYYDSGPIYALKLGNSGEIISTKSSLIQINSSYDNLISKYISDNAFNSDQFNRLRDFDLFDEMFASDNLYTFSDQNINFSYFSSLEASGYQFLSLDDLSHEALLEKWTLIQQNLNPKLDTGLKNDNKRSILAIENANFSASDSHKYLTYIDQTVNSSTVYFLSDGTRACVAEINGQARPLESGPSGLLQMTGVSFQEGINIITTDGSMRPILIKLPEQPKVQTNLSISYSKINPAHYKINFNDANERWFLEFADNFNSNWNIYASSSLLAKPIVNKNDHFVADGYANGYRIVSEQLLQSGVVKQNDDGSYSGSFDLIFWPEKLLLPMVFVSIISLIVMLSILVFSPRINR